jgi:cytoskeletal protein CcmA (bactofilin family)
MRSKCGNVLPLVLDLLLVLSILVTAMLKMPGALRRNVSLVAKETQEMYLAESAVLAKLNGFPDGYFAELPIVESRILGPWTEWRIRNKFQFMLGLEYGRFSTSEWARCAVVLEQNLRECILRSAVLKNLSGNRRFFKLDSSDGLSAERTMAINVSAGDLTLDLGESRAFENLRSSQKLIRSFMANVEGDVKIRGNVHFDSLRVYATGSVSVQGNVTADFAEIFGLASVTVSGNVSMAGALLSKQNIEISDRAQMNFPSVALAVGYRENRLSLLEKSVFEGLAIAPSGTVERDSSAKLLDSTQALLPFCMDTRNVVFSRRRL